MRTRLLSLAALVLLSTPIACTPSPAAVRSQTPSPAAEGPTPVPSLEPSSAPSATVTPVASPSPTPYPRLAIPFGTPRCHTWQLEVAFIGEGAAAGNLLATFEMRNRSRIACWVYGFVGFQLLDRNGRALPETRSWSTYSFFGRSDPPTQILLPTDTPGLATGMGPGHAFFNIATDDVLCGTDYLTAIASLEIWPPDEYASLVIPARDAQAQPFIACGGLTLNPLQVQPHPALG